MGDRGQQLVAGFVVAEDGRPFRVELLPQDVADGAELAGASHRLLQSPVDARKIQFLHHRDRGIRLVLRNRHVADGQQRLDPRQQHGQVDGLRHVVVGAVAEGLHHDLGPVAGRGDDHGQHGGQVPASNLLEQVEPVSLVQIGIEDDQRDGVVVQLPEGIGLPPGHSDVVAPVGQELAQDAATDIPRVHDQNSFGTRSVFRNRDGVDHDGMLVDEERLVPPR